MRGKVGRAVAALLDRLKEEPLSARVIALVGLLLALVSAIDQDFIPVPSWYEDRNKWVAFALTLILLIVSAWFAADVRRIRRWSGISEDLQARVMELDSVHPDALTATLESVHDGEEAVARGDELREAVAAVATVFSKAHRAPNLQEIARVEAAAAAATAPTRDEREPTWLGTESSEVLGSWQSVAKVRAAARRASAELASVGDRSSRNAAQPIDGRDPRNRWTELVGLATVVVGLVAVPNVAGGLADDASTPGETGSSAATEPVVIDALQELDGAIAELTETLASDEPTREVATKLTSLENELKNITSALQPEREIAVVETIAAGATLWAKAREHCENNGTAGEIAADVISLWDANTSVIGDDPNAIDVGEDLEIVCAD